MITPHCDYHDTGLEKLQSPTLLALLKLPALLLLVLSGNPTGRSLDPNLLELLNPPGQLVLIR